MMNMEYMLTNLAIIIIVISVFSDAGIDVSKQLKLTY